MNAPSLMSSFADMTIALSISESPDLTNKGLVPTQMDLAMQELARYLLAQGATLAYGGDLRPSGFTDQLFQLVATYRREQENAVERIHNYLAWPIYLETSPSMRERLAHLATFHHVPPPIVKGQYKIDPSSIPKVDAGGRYQRSISLTEMRRAMHKKCVARIILGGKLVGYSGRCPGLLEEAWLALQDKIPLYILGGFGGCAERIAQSLLGKKPIEFNEGYQVTHDPRPVQPLKELLNTYRIQSQNGDRFAELLDYQTVLKELSRIGPKGLNNGLSSKENKRLFCTPYLAEMIQLILKGLSEIRKPKILKQILEIRQI